MSNNVSESTVLSKKSTSFDELLSNSALYLYLILILALTVFFRFHNIGKAPFWLDEAWVVESINKPTLSEAIHHTGWKQTSPPGFIALLREISKISSTEAALRSIPVINGLLAIIAVGIFAHQLKLSKTGIVMAMILLSLSPEATNLSRQLKQYSGDLLFVILIFLFTYFHCLKKFKYSALFITAISSAFIFMSHLSVFASCASIVILLFNDIYKTEKHLPTVFTIIYALFIVLLSLSLYLPSYNYIETTEMINEWIEIDGMPDSNPENPWFLNSLVDFFKFHWKSHGNTFLILTAAGIVFSLYKKHWWVSIPCILTFIIMIIASSLHLYPFGGNRLTLGLISLAIIPIAYAAEVFSNWSAAKLKTSHSLTGLLTITIIASPFMNSLPDPLMPYQDIRAVCTAFSIAVKPHDIIWVLDHATPAFRLYANEDLINRYYDSPKKYKPELLARNLIKVSHIQTEELEEFDEFSDFKRGPLIWTLFSHPWRFKDADALSEHMTSSAELLLRLRYKGALVLCWKPFPATIDLNNYEKNRRNQDAE